MKALFTSYTNGAIRNASGTLVAFYSAGSGELVIDGFAQSFHAFDLEHAMDLVAQHVAR